MVSFVRQAFGFQTWEPKSSRFADSCEIGENQRSLSEPAGPTCTAALHFARSRHPSPGHHLDMRLSDSRHGRFAVDQMPARSHYLNTKGRISGHPLHLSTGPFYILESCVNEPKTPFLSILAFRPQQTCRKSLMTSLSAGRAGTRSS